MKAYVGVDIGGTFTDYVAISNGNVLFGGKVPNEGNYINAFGQCLKVITDKISPHEIARITISTTSMTNYITSNKFAWPDYVIMPGPGINPKTLPIPQNYTELNAAIDFRGREITPLSLQDKDALSKLNSSACAVIGKFSGRNPVHELQSEKILKERNAVQKTYLGHKVSAQLNFPRRINTTLFYCITDKPFISFRNEIIKLLEAFQLPTKAYFLTAQGGLFKLADENINPAETVLSGPVGSVLGAKALFDKEAFITVDIGGTTTDLGIVLDDKPLYADKGISLNDYPTSISSFAVYSAPVGGDSPIDLTTGSLLPNRVGPAIAFGGKDATLTDALNVLNLIQAGNFQLSKSKLNEQLAQKALDFALSTLKGTINKIFKSWQNESAYNIWQLKQPARKMPDYLLGLGGAAPGLTEQLAALLGMKPVFVNHYEIANAIGTALAQPSVTVTLYQDTAQKVSLYVEKGEKVTSRITNIEEMKEYALKLAEKEFSLHSVGDNPVKLITQEEQFNVLRGFSTTDKIMNCKVVIPADVIYRVVK